MTNEQAAIKLQNILNDDTYSWHPAHAEALEMAVEALKGGDGDCISRKEAIEVINAVFPVNPMKSEYAQGIACGAALAKTYVEQLPSAQPELRGAHEDGGES